MSIETPELVAKVKRILPDFSKAHETFSDPEKISQIVFPLKLKLDAPEIDFETKSARMRMIEAANSALEKIRVTGVHATFNQTEINAMKTSIILTVRPALLIENGKYLPAPPCLPGSNLDWNAILEPHRDGIQKTIESVGRIEFLHHDGTEWNMGTGFLVADDVIMTNRHVAEFFCDKNSKTGEWVFQTDTKKRRIDYCAEKDATSSREFKIKKILKIYDQPDLALFKVTKISNGQDHPKPLVLASVMPDSIEDANAYPIKHRNVYAVGYPDSDPSREDDASMRLVFNNIFKVKRLQPGTFTGIQDGESVLYHDCSTIAGNSGSCIIDINLNQVIGLHFSGILTSEYNEAVALPLLSESIKNEFKQYGIEFSQD